MPSPLAVAAHRRGIAGSSADGAQRVIADSSRWSRAAVGRDGSRRGEATMIPETTRESLLAAMEQFDREKRGPTTSRDLQMGPKHEPGLVISGGVGPAAKPGR